MYHLNTQTPLALEDEGYGDLFSRIDWNVSQNRSLDGALDEEVRQ